MIRLAVIIIKIFTRLIDIITFYYLDSTLDNALDSNILLVKKWHKYLIEFGMQIDDICINKDFFDNQIIYKMYYQTNQLEIKLRDINNRYGPIYIEVTIIKPNGLKIKYNGRLDSFYIFFIFYCYNISGLYLFKNNMDLSCVYKNKKYYINLINYIYSYFITSINDFEIKENYLEYNNNQLKMQDYGIDRDGNRIIIIQKQNRSIKFSINEHKLKIIFQNCKMIENNLSYDIPLFSKYSIHHENAIDHINSIIKLLYKNNI